MAKDAKAAAQEVEQGEAPKKNKKLLIIILAVLILALAGGAAFFLLKKGDEHADDDEAAETTHVKKKEKKNKEAHPVFINLEPFTVNLIPETGDQYLQITITLEAEDPTTEPEIKNHIPRIRNNLTLLLSSKKPSELMLKEGKEKLSDELKEAINDILEPPKKNRKGEVVRSQDGPVKEVLFTSFIIQ